MCMDAVQSVSDYLTPAVCAAYCSHVEGALFFGVQNGRKCFCGASYGRHGVAALSTACNTPCGGDDTQVCGGFSINSVYALSVPEDRYPGVDIQPTISPTPSAHAIVAKEEQEEAEKGFYRGCFSDPPEAPILDGAKLVDRLVPLRGSQPRGEALLGTFHTLFTGFASSPGRSQ